MTCELHLNIATISKQSFLRIYDLLKEYFLFLVNSELYVYQTLYAKTLNIYVFYPSRQEFKKL